MAFPDDKKIYFAILAHTNEKALAAQVQNIRHFNPDAGIIVYNGGKRRNFGANLDVFLYPDSHPIRHGNLTPYFWEIMKWLEEHQVNYEYLINLDHDVLFIKHGFQDYLDKVMKYHDVMGWDMVTSLSPRDTGLSCCQDMWKEWKDWGPFFGTEYFIRFLNPAQVYRRSIVRNMLEALDHQDVKNRIAAPRVFALEEMFFVTLALSLGGRIREYPREENWKSVSRFGHEQISMDEVRLIKRHPYYFWIHPVKEERLIRMNRWLMGLKDQEKQLKAKNIRSDKMIRPIKKNGNSLMKTSMNRKPAIKKKTNPKNPYIPKTANNFGIKWIPKKENGR